MKILKLFLFLFLNVSFCIVSAQTKKLNGLISDYETGKPIPNVAVAIDSINIKYYTDSTGVFQINIPDNFDCKLLFSGLGYKPQSYNYSSQKDNGTLVIKLQKKDFELEEIVVTGTGTPNQIGNTPVKTELITKKDITQSSSGSFDDLMSTLSPSFDYSPGSMGSFIQLNGLGNDYILFLIDGKQMHGNIGGQSDLNRISTNNIERIEVVKGASSSLYGSEAIAGVINIITKKAGKGLSFENDSRYDSQGDWQQFNSLNICNNRLNSKTSFTHKQSNGWQLSKYELEDQGNDDPADDELVFIYDKAVNEFSDYQLQQDLSIKLSQKLSLRGGGSFYKKSTLMPIEAKAYGYDYQDMSGFFGAKCNFGDKNSLNIDYQIDDFRYYYLYTRKYDVKITDESGDQIITYREGDRPLQTSQVRQSAHLKGVFNLDENNRLSTGAECINELLEAPNRLIDEKHDVYTYALYAQDELSLFSSLFITIGGRYNLHQEFGGKLTPKLSIMYKINKVRLRATYSAGYKAPTLKELYYRYEKSGMGSHYLYLGDPALKPQSSDYFSASINYTSFVLSVDLSAYTNQINNLIAYKIIETSLEDAERGVKTTKINSNIEKAKSSGLDFMLKLQVGKNISTGIGYSYIKAQNITEDLPLEGTAEHYATFNSSWQKNFNKYVLGMHLFGKIQTERYYNDGNALAHAMWKLTSTHDFKLNNSLPVKITCGIDNLFNYIDDRPYGSHYSTLSPGRTYFLGLNITLSNQ